jgi:hypothetical protein
MWAWFSGAWVVLGIVLVLLAMGVFAGSSSGYP